MTNRKLRLESLERRQLLAVTLQPAGTEFPVNTSTADYQEQSAVTVENDGDFIVVWSSHDGDGGIYGKMFAADGSATSDEFLISNVTEGTQVYPDVAVDPASGGFVVTWQHDSPPGDGTPGESDIFARAFAADGTAVGDQAQVSPDEGDHFGPAIAFTTTGEYVIAWDSFTASSENNVSARHFTSTNATEGATFAVSTGTEEFSPDVASAGDGSFVVAWESTDADGSGIAAQRFDSASGPVGTPIAVNATTAGHQTSPSIAVQSGGSFIVTWLSGTDVLGQLFANNGSNVGVEIDVNDTNPARAYTPSSATLNDGGFLVTWTDDALDVVGRSFESDGSPVGAAIVLNTTTAGDQLAPKLSSAANHVVATWTGPDADGDGIFGQTYSTNVLPTADAGGPYQVGEGGSVTLNAAGSTDPDSETLTYAWDLDNDGQYDDATGVQATFSAAGIDGPATATVGLRVSDGNATDTATAQVTVNNVAPTADAGGPYNLLDGGTILMNAGGSTDPIDEIVSYEWDFDGDGTFETHGKTLTRRFDLPDTFDVTLRVTDDDGATDTDTVPVTVTLGPVTDLGVIAFNEVTGAYPSTGYVWYQVETSQAGFLTVLATPSSGEATVSIYSSSRAEPPLATGVTSESVNRVDHEVTAGGTYFVKVSGSSNDVDLTLVNLVRHAGANVTVSGTDEDDTFVFSAESSRDITIKGVNYHFEDSEVATVDFDGGDGFDDAWLYDSSGDEHFEAWPDHGEFSNGPGDSTTDFTVQVIGTESLLAYARQDGNDLATLHGSDNTDKFKSYEDSLRLRGTNSGYALRSKFFDTVAADAGTNGPDIAVFNGTDGNETFRYLGATNAAKVEATGRDHTATGFSRVTARAGNGSNDVAYFTDVPAEDARTDDVFYFKSHKTHLRGRNVDIIARAFDEVHATASESGEDVARIYDTAANEHLEVDGDTVRCYRRNDTELDLVYEALGFETVKAYSTNDTDTRDVDDNHTIEHLLLYGWGE